MFAPRSSLQRSVSVGSPLRREAAVRSEPVTASRRNALDRLPESSHVTEVGLDTATDAEVWTYAGEHGFVIVSKVSDFRQLAFLHGPPPKAIRVRLGNATTRLFVSVRMPTRLSWCFLECRSGADGTESSLGSRVIHP
jgi:predicted nuclease of predicted toxin-antitoxin system